jgi:hypothetical protein
MLELNKIVNLLDENRILATIPRPKLANAPLNDNLLRDQLPRQQPDTIRVDVEAIKSLLRDTRNSIP